MKKLFVHPQCPFSVDTFNLVSAQFQDEFNCHDFYLLHHNDFLTYVENPLKYIFKQVEKLLPASIQKFIPINSESFGYIKKEGLESIDCSIALGFKDICSVDDPQFMLSFEKQKLTFGFYAKSDSAAWIIQNYQDCLQYSKDAEKLLKAYKLPNYYQCYLTQKIIRNNSQKPKTIEETIQPQKNIYTLLKAICLSELIDEHFYPDKITNIRVILSLDFPKLLGLSAKKIILLIAQTFKQMFPLFLCSKRYPEYSPVIVISRYISVYETEFNQFYDIAEISEITGFQTSELDRWIRTINRKQQAILQGPPGTGKTFLAQKLAQHLIGGGDGFSDIIQFHPAYTYEDFIQDIRPQSQNGQLTTNTIN
ncbi:MAG: AAA family ATPase [Oscillatoriaceae cyanobacterium Prado104]|jgi:5-methylcytosine-specific restriction protein B|nr:AAA family ATPase [Oscillatoriaceae cyanobacterium Prado104]